MPARGGGYPTTIRITCNSHYIGMLLTEVFRAVGLLHRPKTCNNPNRGKTVTSLTCCNTFVTINT